MIMAVFYYVKCIQWADKVAVAFNFINIHGRLKSFLPTDRSHTTEWLSRQFSLANLYHTESDNSKRKKDVVLLSDECF